MFLGWMHYSAQRVNLLLCVSIYLILEEIRLPRVKLLLHDVHSGTKEEREKSGNDDITL